MARPDVSEHHALLSIDENHTVFLAHLDASHATFLNEQPLAASAPAPLQHLDTFRIADRYFRIEYTPLSFPLAASTPTKGTPSRLSAPLAVISASPASPQVPATTPRKPRVSAEKRDSNGNTGSTVADKAHGHTSTPTPNRRKSITTGTTSTAQRLSASPAGVKAKGGKSSMSPQEKNAAERKSGGGDSTPKSQGKKRRPSMPSSSTPSPSSSLPSPSPPKPADPASTAEAVTTSSTSSVKESAELTAEAEGERPLSPQSIADISASSSAESPLDELAVFELPMCSGPLSTLMEDPEEEDDPPAPAPHTRRFLPTPVRKEVEVKARVIAGMAREKLETTVIIDAAVSAAGQTDEEQARVSISDGDVCHVDDEIVLSPGTLHRRALHARHIRYGRVIVELKSRMASKNPPTPVRAPALQSDSEETAMELVPLDAPHTASPPLTVDIAPETEDMETEELPAAVDEGPRSPGAASLPALPARITPALPTPVRKAIRERPPRLNVGSALSAQPTLPTPVKKAIRARPALKHVPSDDVRAATEEGEQGSAFLPVAELLAHETKIATRHSLPGRAGKRQRQTTKSRASAAPLRSSPTTSTTAEVLETPVEKEAALELPINHKDVSMHAFSASPVTHRRSLSAQPSSSGQPSSALASAHRAVEDDDPPMSPPLSATTLLSTVPSTPTSPSKALRQSLRPAEADHPIVPKPLPALPTPVRRSIRERAEAREAAAIKMPTPLKKADAKQPEKEISTPQPITLPVFTSGSVSARRSLPAGGATTGRAARSERQRETSSARLAMDLGDQLGNGAAEVASDRAGVPTVIEEAPATTLSSSATVAPATVAELSAGDQCVLDFSPSSPPAAATISLDEVPPTPSTPHKSTVKRLSRTMEGLAVTQAPTSTSEEKSSAAAASFVPLDRPVESRHSLPAEGGRRTQLNRPSAAPRMHYDEKESEVAMIDVDDSAAVEMAEASSASPALPVIKFSTTVPAARHSLPAPALGDARSDRRRTAAPTAAYVDAVVTAPVLPSPIRRGIEERPPRAAPTILQPLLSPVRRAIQRGVPLRPVIAAPPAQDAHEAQSVTMEVEEVELAAADLEAAVPLEQGMAEAKPAARRGRKRKADVTAAIKPPVTSPELRSSTRSKRGRILRGLDAPAVPVEEATPAPTPTVKARAGRTAKGKKMVTIVEQAEVAPAVVDDSAAEESAVVPTPRTRKGRARAEAAEAPPERPPRARITRSGRQAANAQAMEEIKEEAEAELVAPRARGKGRAAAATTAPLAVAAEEPPTVVKAANAGRRGRASPALLQLDPEAVVEEASTSSTTRTRKTRARRIAAELPEGAGTAPTSQPTPRTRKGRKRPLAEAVTDAPVASAEVEVEAEQQRTARGRPRRDAKPVAATEEQATQEVVAHKRVGKRKQPPVPAPEPVTTTVRVTRSRARS